MSRTFNAIAAALAAAVLLAACGGGGGGATAPIPKPAPQATATSRAAVGTVKLTFALTGYKHASSGKILRAAASTTRRNAKFIDPIPSPAPSAGLVYPILDIFVDGTLQANLDGQVGPSHSMYVNATNGDGSVSVSLPLYSVDNNTIVAVEYDYNATNILSLGETNLGNFQSGFSAGTQQNVSLVMQQNVAGVGMVDEPNEYSPTVMTTDNDPADNPPSISFGCSAGRIGFYPVDSLGNFLSFSGTSNGNVATWDPSQSSSYNEGTTTLAGTSFGTGIYSLVFDNYGDPYFAAANATNPAWSIYSDVTSAYQTNVNNTSSYAYGYAHNPQLVNGSNQGIYNLVQAEAIDPSKFSSYSFEGYGKIIIGGC